MPRPRRQTPTGQMSLFGHHPDAKRQNNRWVLTATATVEQLLEAVPRAPEDHYGVQTEIQRPLHRAHCYELARHYTQVGNWVIAPFVFTSEATTLDVVDGKFGSLKADVQLLDGQHRTQALHIAVEDLRAENTPHTADKLRVLLESAVVLQFLENFGPSDASQLFVDLNKGKRVTTAELAYLDGRDPMVNIVKAALSATEWVSNRTDTTRANPDPTGSDIFTVGLLKTVVKAIEVGVLTPIPRARRTYLSTDTGKEESVNGLVGFFEWLPTARDEYQYLIDEPDRFVPDERTRHYAYEPKFIALLADTWSKSVAAGPNVDQLAAAVNGLNIARNDPANDLVRHLDLLDQRGRLRPFNRGPYTEASLRIRDQAKSTPV